MSEWQTYDTQALVRVWKKFAADISVILTREEELGFLYEEEVLWLRSILRNQQLVADELFNRSDFVTEDLTGGLNV